MLSGKLWGGEDGGTIVRCLQDSLTGARNVGLARTGTYAYSTTTKLARFLHGDEAESCHGDFRICAEHVTLHKQTRVFIGVPLTECQFLLGKICYKV